MADAFTVFGHESCDKTPGPLEALKLGFRTLICLKIFAECMVELW